MLRAAIVSRSIEPSGHVVEVLPPVSRAHPADGDFPTRPQRWHNDTAEKHQRSKQQMLTGRQRINLIHDGRQMKSHDVCWDVQCRCSPNWGENRIRQTKATTWVKIVMSRPTAHFGLASLFHSFTDLQQKRGLQVSFVPSWWHGNEQIAQRCSRWWYTTGYKKKGQHSTRSVSFGPATQLESHQLRCQRCAQWRSSRSYEVTASNQEWYVRSKGVYRWCGRYKWNSRCAKW